MTKKVQKPGARTRQLEQEWKELLLKQTKPLERGARAKGVKLKAKTKLVVGRPHLLGHETTHHVPSVDSGKGFAAASPAKQYSGNKMLGLSQMHKSNLVPVFDMDSARDISKMRRG